MDRRAFLAATAAGATGGLFGGWAEPDRAQESAASAGRAYAYTTRQPDGSAETYVVDGSGHYRLVARTAPAERPQQDIILPWQQTVPIEHQDRMARLRRIASEMGLDVRPQFYSYVIPSSRLPPGYPNMPVLRVVFPEKTFFDTASAELKPEAQRVIELIAASLQREPPDVAVFIAGHTDARGGEAYNYNLSVRRAETVAEALDAIGVGQVSLWRVGFGKSVPMYPETTEPWLGFNRRVEFLFAGKVEAVGEWLSHQLETVCVGSTPEQVAACQRHAPITRQFEAVEVARNGKTSLASIRKAGEVSPSHGQTSVIPAPRPAKDSLEAIAFSKMTIDIRNPKYTIEQPKI